MIGGDSGSEPPTLLQIVAASEASWRGVYSVNGLSVCPAGTDSSSGSVNAPPSPGGQRDLEEGGGLEEE